MAARRSGIERVAVGVDGMVVAPVERDVAMRRVPGRRSPRSDRAAGGPLGAWSAAASDAASRSSPDPTLRSITTARMATPTARTALMVAATCIAWTNASRATSMTAAPSAAGSSLGHGRGPTERVAGRRRGLAGNAGGQAGGDVAAVDGDADAAQDRDAQRAARARRRSRRCPTRHRPSRAGRSPTMSSVVRPTDRRQAQRDDDRAHDHDGQPVRARDLGQQPEPDRRQPEPAAHHVGRPDAPHDPRRRVGPDDEADRRRQRPEARLERRQAEHELQVLRHEQEVADRDEDRQEVDGQRRAERAGSGTAAGRSSGRRGVRCRRTNRTPDDEADHDRRHRQRAEAVLGRSA